MRRVGVAAVMGLAVIGLALALVPFARPQPRGSFTYGPGFSSRCSSPIVAVWRADHDAGWFGYNPLTSTPTSFPTCRGAARTRLTWGCASLAGAAVLTIVLRRRRPTVEANDAEAD